MGFVLLGCYTELLDEQYRTARRRLPADVAAADPDIFRRRGLTETSSPAPCSAKAKPPSAAAGTCCGR
jgi:hypothetical protein